MKKYDLIEKKTGRVIVTVICYEKKTANLLLKQLRKIRGLNVKEVEK